MRTGRRLHAIDRLKAAAIVAVLLTHAAASTPFTVGGLWETLLCRSWTRFHVPSFLFASGLLLARGPRPNAALLRDRWARVLVPYLVVSLAAFAAGATLAKRPGEMAFALATGSASGIYYYVFLVALLIPLAWPLARTSRTAASLLLVATLLMGLAQAFGWLVPPSQWLLTWLREAPVPRHEELFWSLRDPFANFWICYFVAGWIAGRSIPQLARLRSRCGAALAIACGCAVVLGIVHLVVWNPVKAPERVGRLVYSFAVIGLVGAVRCERPAGRVVRFLSEASLGIYLLHWMPQQWLLGATRTWPEPWGIAARTIAGLGAAVLVLIAARQLLGRERARRWLGA